jgi:hypothetical protein
VPFAIDVKKERRKYLEIVKVNRDTYASINKSRNRTREIFNTFVRVFKGRSKLPKKKKEAQMKNLSHIVQQEILSPLCRKPGSISNSQSKFDQWHKKTVAKLKRDCLVRLTTGMAQKIINLHCKDLWALELVPKKYSCYFHPIIDKVTLDGVIGRTISWTKLESYEEYMELQSIFRSKACRNNANPLSYECHIWNKNRSRPKKDT